ncbi:MAG: Na/Pi cotransporter family protein [Myxococcales bacterium]|nr:Na/Pi cotransporter family protein [Myxococcales bacterium]MCB9630373.1 Na/Pi cotransporter family protein [Sandaracinaceae bacterium]
MNAEAAAAALGGIGLFLMGMLLVTDGLRAAAGDSLRRTLLRFTGGPLPAFLSGVGLTALLQSSSAVSLLTIGFVGAGLLGFEQALGLILGANVGTTATGFIVALVGLELKISVVALPLIGVGALMRIFSKGRSRDLGWALAGFGMIFVGIDSLQQGMQAAATVVTPADFPAPGPLGNLALAGIGLLVTAVMQSSSAAAATALSAVHAGTIDVTQAAAMIIGVNVGTTVTAMIAAAGASVAAKRVAVAHLLFNLVTAGLAFALLPLFLNIANTLAEGNAATAIAVFHAVFNITGVIVVWPFLRRFAETVKRLVPERKPRLTRRLDPTAARLGAVAVEAVRETAIDVLHTLSVTGARLLSSGAVTDADRDELSEVRHALDAVDEYLSAVRTDPLSAEEHERHVDTMHALDYLRRMQELLTDRAERALAPDPELAEARGWLASLMNDIARQAEDPSLPAPIDRVEQVANLLHERRQTERPTLLERVARGELPPARGSARLEAGRRLDELGYYLARVTDHLSGPRSARRG